ncbi:MAG: 50S ribosomal protein L11 methyltransferase [Muribaculaceae bacterium]|nr:50S ribosomal protein L11 methyltransferase [Muribaculaceae bacterium]
MQDYISLRLDVAPCCEDATDLLAAFLCEIGYESFTSDDEGMTAFIKDSSYDEEKVKEIISEFPMPVKIVYSTELVKGEDWNEEWEKNYFQPIIIDGKCVVHSSFHTDVPEAEYDIVVDPKMAFGTGHHSTTYNMMRHLLSMDLKGKTVIDMGTGTGILAILAAMAGAMEVTGIEIDPYACENAVENVRLNGVDATMICGDASSLQSLPAADLFLANINRNVITSDIDRYSRALKTGGEMLLSGFYKEDIPIVEEAARKEGLETTGMLEDNNWVALRLVKRD